MSYIYIIMALRKNERQEMKVVIVGLLVIVVLYLGYKNIDFSKEETMSVKKERVEGVSHGDHWGSVFGFQEEIHHKIDESVQALANEKVLDKNLSEWSTDYGIVSNVALVKENEVITFFPFLKIDRTLPVKISKVVEWEVTDGLEAHVLGAGHDKFAIGFFATDYAQNSALYKEGEHLNVALSAFAYVIEKSSMGEDTNSSDEIEISFANDFCGYFPSSELNTGFDYEFVGTILSLEKFDYQDEKFVLLEVKLINAEDTNFTLPMAVNVKNMRDADIKQGDSISGIFWLQGRVGV